MTPDILFAAVTRGGNHLFGHIFGADSQGRPTLNLPALAETLRVYGDDILSDLYIGWTRGFLDAERSKLEDAFGEGGALETWNTRVYLSHPREALETLARDLEDHPEWLR